MKNPRQLIIYFLALNLLLFGVDKFFQFIPESCTLAENASKNMWYGVGVAELIMAILLFAGKLVKPVLVTVILLMLWAIAGHLNTNTTDFGGAIFLAVVALLPMLLKDRRLA